MTDWMYEEGFFVPLGAKALMLSFPYPQAMHGDFSFYSVVASRPHINFVCIDYPQVFSPEDGPLQTSLLLTRLTVHSGTFIQYPCWSLTLQTQAYGL